VLHDEQLLVEEAGEEDELPVAVLQTEVVELFVVVELVEEQKHQEGAEDEELQEVVLLVVLQVHLMLQGAPEEVLKQARRHQRATCGTAHELQRATFGGRGPLHGQAILQGCPSSRCGRGSGQASF